MRAEEKPLAEMTIRRYLIGLKADIPERTKRAFGNDMNYLHFKKTN